MLSRSTGTGRKGRYHDRSKQRRFAFLVKKRELFLLYIEIDATVKQILDRGKNLKRIPAQSRQLADEKDINAIFLAILNRLTQHWSHIIFFRTRDVFLEYLANFHLLIFSVVRQVLDLTICALSVTNAQYSGIDDCLFLIPPCVQNMLVFKKVC